MKCINDGVDCQNSTDRLSEPKHRPVCTPDSVINCRAVDFGNENRSVQDLSEFANAKLKS